MKRNLMVMLMAVAIVLMALVYGVAWGGEPGYLETLTVTATTARVEFTNNASAATSGPASDFMWSRPAAMLYVMHNPARVWTVATYAVVNDIDFLLESYTTNVVNWETTFTYPCIWQEADKFAIEVTPPPSSNVTYILSRE